MMKICTPEEFKNSIGDPKKPSSEIELYRWVGKGELDSIKINKRYTIKDGGYEGKLFYTNKNIGDKKRKVLKKFIKDLRSNFLRGTSASFNSFFGENSYGYISGEGEAVCLSSCNFCRKREKQNYGEIMVTWGKKKIEYKEPSQICICNKNKEV